jgi:UDP-glucose 4-epimerase
VPHDYFGEAAGPWGRGYYSYRLGHWHVVSLNSISRAGLGSDGRQTRCFCHVRDTVQAIIELARCPDAVGQVFNIGSTEEVSILELARRIIQLLRTLDLKPSKPGDDIDPIVFVPYDQAYQNDFEDMQRRVPDISKVKQFIGWAPEHSLDEILTDIIASSLGKDAAAVKPGAAGSRTP